MKGNLARSTTSPEATPQNTVDFSNVIPRKMSKRSKAKDSTKVITSTEIAYHLSQACGEAKAKDPVVLNMHTVSDLADYFIVVSGRSDRQVQGIANHVLEAMGKLGLSATNIEGLEGGHWVVIDCSDVVVHIFFDPIRGHYDIEGLWARAKRVNIKPSKKGSFTEKVTSPSKAHTVRQAVA